jgi:flagellar protein FliL
MMTPAEDADASRKPSMILTLGLLAVLSAVAAGGGWVLGERLAPPPPAAVVLPERQGAGDVPEGAAEGVAQQMIDLDPITTNLSYPAENWIRLEISLLFSEQADRELAQTIHQDVLAYLRTVSLQQIEGPRGFQHLREDLLERAKLRSEGKVADLLFRTFVIE